MPKQKTVPLLPQDDANFVYGVAYTVFRFYLFLSARLRVEGLENVPRTGGAVVVCNHTRGNDYFPLGVSSPRALAFMIKSEAFEWGPVLRWALYQGGAFPVERGTGDMDALRTAVRLAKAGRPLAMFPEGHRSEDGKLQRGHTGAARIALEAGVPVVPAVVINAEAGWNNFPRFWKRPIVVTRFGPPFYLEEGAGNDRRAVANGHRKIMTTLASMLPEEMRGVWGDPSLGGKGARPRATASAATVSAATVSAASVPAAPEPAAPEPAAPEPAAPEPAAPEPASHDRAATVDS